jgi:hypothetical protein
MLADIFTGCACLGARSRADETGLIAMQNDAGGEVRCLTRLRSWRPLST